MPLLNSESGFMYGFLYRRPLQKLKDNTKSGPSFPSSYLIKAQKRRCTWLLIPNGVAPGSWCISSVNACVAALKAMGHLNGPGTSLHLFAQRWSPDATVSYCFRKHPESRNRGDGRERTTDEGTKMNEQNCELFCRTPRLPFHAFSRFQTNRLLEK